MVTSNPWRDYKDLFDLKGPFRSFSKSMKFYIIFLKKSSISYFFFSIFCKRVSFSYLFCLCNVYSRCQINLTWKPCCKYYPLMPFSLFSTCSIYLFIFFQNVPRNNRPVAFLSFNVNVYWSPSTFFFFLSILFKFEKHQWWKPFFWTKFFKPIKRNQLNEK
jgi:hypothetical protein